MNYINPSVYGTLNTYNVVFDGATLNMNIKANDSESDQINVAGQISKCTIQGNSSINVTMQGGPATENSTWTLIHTPNAITGDFQTKNLPGDVYEETPVGNNWSCVTVQSVSSPGAAACPFHP